MSISDPATRTLANEILSAQVIEHPWFYILLIAISLTGSAIGALVASYFKRRGETLATKADFDELLNQLQQSTQLAEEIKADIQSKYGEQSTLRALLRDRTESIIMATFELESWLEAARSRALYGEPFNWGGSPISKISALRDIYFPEVSVEFHELKLRYVHYVQWILGLQEVRLNSGGQAAAMKPYLSTFLKSYQPFSDALEPFRMQIIEAARARGGL